MKKRVVMRIKVADSLKNHFQAAAWRTNQTPSYLLRKMMMGYVWITDDPKAVDLTVVSNSCWHSEHLDAPEGHP